MGVDEFIAALIEECCLSQKRAMDASFITQIRAEVEAYVELKKVNACNFDLYRAWIISRLQLRRAENMLSRVTAAVKRYDDEKHGKLFDRYQKLAGIANRSRIAFMESL